MWLKRSRRHGGPYSCLFPAWARLGLWPFQRCRSEHSFRPGFGSGHGEKYFVGSVRSTFILVPRHSCICSSACERERAGCKFRCNTWILDLLGNTELGLSQWSSEHLGIAWAVLLWASPTQCGKFIC